MFVTGAILAQPSAEFYAVSIRPHGAGPRPIPAFTTDGDTYRAVGVTLAELVAAAYGVRRNQVVIDGTVPDRHWMTSESFDIEAKASGEGTPAWSLQDQCFRQRLSTASS